jgi:hypothetical protein
MGRTALLADPESRRFETAFDDAWRRCPDPITLPARAANPAVGLVATLSTQPGTGPANGWQLARAAAARPYVQGFQLNLTRRSTRAAVPFLLRTFPALRG